MKPILYHISYILIRRVIAFLSSPFTRRQGGNIILLILIGTTFGTQSLAQIGRILNTEDMFNLQEPGRYFGGPASFSPDGKQLAFIVQRSKNSNKYYWPRLYGNERSDIYVLTVGNSNPINITNGLADNAGYWALSWSPNSKRLAMLSTKDGSIHLWVWDQETGALSKVTNRGVDVSWPLDLPYAWVSPTRILCPVLPSELMTNGLLTNVQRMVEASGTWSRILRDGKSSASVLSSGVRPDLSKRPQGELVAIDIESGDEQVVTVGRARSFIVSPDQNAIAYVKQVEIYQPQADEPLQFDSNRSQGIFELEIMSIDGVSLLSRKAATFDVIPTSLRWSHDGGELAFLTYTKNNNPMPCLARFIKSQGELKVTNIDKIDPFPLVRREPQIEWTEDGWIVLASRQGEGNKTRVHARRDWWLIRDDGSIQTLTDKMTIVPSMLWREAGRSSFVGLADGKLWRISPKTPPQNITLSIKQSISSILWPQRDKGIGEFEVPKANLAYKSLVICSQIHEERRLFIVDLSSGRVTPMELPAMQAKVTTLSIASGATLYTLSDQTGLHFWIAPRLGVKASMIYESNTFLREILPGAFRKIEYRSLNGQVLSGWIILPPLYQPGKKYPLITWVYPGWVAGDSPPQSDDISSTSWFNLQIAAAQGFVVLRPSIPLAPEGDIDDPLLKLAAGVLPAVEKVIDIGILDPERVFVLGHSFGGFATYGLITQTHRFKAAIAMAGLSNLVSGYGQFDTLRRYNEYSHEMGNQARAIETPLRLGSPPWKDFGRYMRNSPIFYVDRVQTPLLIIHGDMDGVPIEQAEEFFMALYRQGKRAEFVRYWGEGHTIESLDNVRDLWKRIFAWLSEFSQQGNPNASRDSSQ